MRNTKETREAIRMLGAIAARTVRNLEDDGRVSIPEGVGYVGDFSEIRAGLKDIGEVPAELADLDDGERIVLLGDIKVELIRAGVSHRIADAAEDILNWAYGTVRLWVKLKTAPPTAEPVS